MADVNTHGMKELRRTQKMAIEELITQVKTFHARVARIYDEANASCKNEESRLILGVLAKHERRIVQHLGTYLAEAPEKVLETRIMYAPEVPLQSLHENISMVVERGRDEIGEAALQISNVIIGIYDTVADASSVEEVREALASLRDFELNELIYALRSTEVE